MNYSVRYGGRKGKRQRFIVSSDLVAVRSNEGLSARSSARRRRGLRALDDFYIEVAFPDSQIEVLRSKVMSGSKARRNNLRSALGIERGIRFAGKVLRDIKPTARFFIPRICSYSSPIRRSERSASRSCKNMVS